jgi:hypothetical protein
MPVADIAAISFTPPRHAMMPLLFIIDEFSS